jgi:predicted phosphodiesterase
MEEQIQNLLNFLKKERELDYLVKKLDLQDYEILGLIEKLKLDNHNIDVYQQNGKVMIKSQANRVIKTENKYELYDGRLKTIRFAFISDTHLCSKHDQLQVLNALYDEFEQRKIKLVLHCGDISEGFYKNRPEHIFQLKAFGSDEQAQYIIENYPKRDKTKTLFISGNHDHTHIKNGGSDIGRQINREREDMEYLGIDFAEVVLNNCKIHLQHPSGGSSYARCFDDKTEILTEDGFKFFKDLDGTEQVATLNVEKNLFEWQKPTDYINEKYEGKMIHFKNKNVDSLVTPNHRMLVRRYNTAIDYSRKEELKYPTKSHRRLNKDWTFKNAEELLDSKRQQWQLKRGGQGWEGQTYEYVDIPFRKPKKFATQPIKHLGRQNIKDVAELIAWYVTEGYCDKKRVCISQYKNVNKSNYYQILDLFERMGFENIKQRKLSTKTICVGSVELAEYLKNECGSYSRNKFLPKWLKNCSKEILEIVFETMIKGDGWISGTGLGYRSYSKQLLEDFCEIAIKLGYAITTREETDDTTNGGSVSISKIQIYPTINEKPQEVFYKGRIYCVSVPNTTVFVRRNGKTYWSGNSYKLQKFIDAMRGGEKPHILAQGHFHKTFYMFYRNIHAFSVPSVQGYTSFQRGLALGNDMGAWVVEAKIDKEGNVITLNPELIPVYETEEKKTEKVKIK